MKQITVEEHLLVKQVAKRLSRSERRIWYLIKLGRETNGQRGIWPIRKDGASTIIPASSINRYLDGCTV